MDIEEEMRKFIMGFSYKPKKRSGMKKWYYNDYLGEWINLERFKIIQIAPAVDGTLMRSVVQARTEQSIQYLSFHESMEDAKKWMDKFMRQHD